MKLARKVVMVGCSNSGTTFMSRYLQACGLGVMHENIGEDGINGYNALDERFLKIYRENLGDYGPFIHQVRHPLKVISSLGEGISEGWDVHRTQQILPGWKDQCHNLHKGASNLERRMRYWLEWNRLCAEYCGFTVMLENFCELGSWDRIRLSARIGFELRDKYLQDVSFTTRTHTHEPNYVLHTWDDLLNENPELAAEVQQQAQRFGYTT